MKKRERICPDTRVSDLVQVSWLSKMTASEMIVLLRLVAATRTQGKRVRITNGELHESRITAQRALEYLSGIGVIAVNLDAHDNSRTVDVLCL
jgi:predicted transcriptional regulator